MFKNIFNHFQVSKIELNNILATYTATPPCIVGVYLFSFYKFINFLFYFYKHSKISVLLYRLISVCPFDLTNLISAFSCEGFCAFCLLIFVCAESISL